MRLHTLLLLSLLAFPTVAAADERMLFAFEDANAAQGWQAVNDGVMGGRSDGRLRITDAGHLEFFGTLSLENNGGFASVRTNGRNLGLQADDAILLRVKGDGREYACNVYAGRNRYSFRQTFTTKKGEWLEVALPLDRFTATWRGRVFPKEQLDPSQITGIGFLLGDKKPGPFTLLVDSIRAGEPSPPESAVTCTGTYPHVGIQTAAFADDRWLFGCYGSPEILLVADSDFSLLGRYEASCSLGVCGLGEGGLLVASGRCDAATGCSGTVRTARPDDERGFTL